jgi:hypothetical protein
VVGKDKILLFQLPGEGKGGKLLPHAGMDSTVELALREEIQEFLLHLPDAERFADDPMIYSDSII